MALSMVLVIDRYLVSNREKLALEKILSGVFARAIVLLIIVGNVLKYL